MQNRDRIAALIAANRNHDHKQLMAEVDGSPTVPCYGDGEQIHPWGRPIPGDHIWVSGQSLTIQKRERPAAPQLYGSR